MLAAAAIRRGGVHSDAQWCDNQLGKTATNADKQRGAYTKATATKQDNVARVRGKHTLCNAGRMPRREDRLEVANVQSYMLTLDHTKQRVRPSNTGRAKQHSYTETTQMPQPMLIHTLAWYGSRHSSSPEDMSPKQMMQDSATPPSSTTLSTPMPAGRYKRRQNVWLDVFVACTV